MPSNNINNLVSCIQTHSNNVNLVSQKDKGFKFKNCDGLITVEKNVVLNIKTADCLPITISHPKLVGLLHSGWRGLENEIIKKAINIINNKFNIDSSTLKIIIGPSIDKENYLVRSDVFNKFKDNYFEYFEKVSSTQWKMDLKGIAIKQLTDLGIKVKNIKVSKISTFKNKKYPSFRRDGKTEGFVTSIMLK